jgi:hypothetical protein
MNLGRAWRAPVEVAVASEELVILFADFVLFRSAIQISAARAIP